MTKRAKRIGRPPGRKAPHRPVLSQRVPQELYDEIKDAARANGRTMGEEMVFRVRKSFEDEKAQAKINEALIRSAGTLSGDLRESTLLQSAALLAGSAQLLAGPANRDLLDELLKRAGMAAPEAGQRRGRFVRAAERIAAEKEEKEEERS